MVFKWIIGSLERGWVQPSSIGMPQRGSRQVFHLAEPRDKNRCVTGCYSCVILFSFTHLIITLSLTLTLWRAIKWRSHLRLSRHSTLVLISLTFHNPSLCHLVLIFTGSPIHPHLGALRRWPSRKPKPCVDQEPVLAGKYNTLISMTKNFLDFIFCYAVYFFYFVDDSLLVRRTSSVLGADGG